MDRSLTATVHDEIRRPEIAAGEVHGATASDRPERFDRRVEAEGLNHQTLAQCAVVEGDEWRLAVMQGSGLSWGFARDRFFGQYRHLLRASSEMRDQIVRRPTRARRRRRRRLGEQGGEELVGFGHEADDRACARNRLAERRPCSSPRSSWRISANR